MDIVFSNGMIIIGIGAASIASLFAYTMGLKRLYGYGLLSLVAFLMGHFIMFPFEYLVTTIGSVIIINGLVLLMKFIQKYPLPQGDKNNAQKSV